jgi:hypothetical protein
MRILAGIFLLLFFFACADLKQSKQLDQLFQIEKKIDSILRELKQENEFKFEQEIKQYETFMFELTMLVTFDTIPESDARTIHRYANFLDEMKNIQNGMQSLRHSIIAQKRSIQNLKKDIQNGFGKRNNYDKYIYFEQIKTQTVEDKLNEIKSIKLKVHSEIINTYLQIRKMIQSIQLKKSSE